MRTRPDVSLREVQVEDLDIFFINLQDLEAIHMAAFTPADPADRTAFDAHWERIMNDPDIRIRTVVCNDQVAGHVACFVREGDREVTFWIGREFWSRGVATLSLRLFLKDFRARPICARVAKENGGSVRVLEKCGFQISGEDRGFAHGRGEEVEEWVMVRRD